MRPPCVNGRDQCNTGSLALCISSLTLVSPAVVVVAGQQDAPQPRLPGLGPSDDQSGDDSRVADGTCAGRDVRRTMAEPTNTLTTPHSALTGIPDQ